jgi:hypothetical protein
MIKISFPTSIAFNATLGKKEDIFGLWEDLFYSLRCKLLMMWGRDKTCDM